MIVAGGVLTQSPRTFLDLDILTELARHNRVLALETYTQFLLLDDDIEIPSTSALGDRNLDVNVCQSLTPSVGQC